MVNKQDYITISEAATILGVTTVTLRNWEKQNKIKSIRDPQNDYRLYSLSQITNLLLQSPNNQKPQTSQTDVLITNRPETGSNIKSLRLVVRQMSKAFRDSQGGSLLERFEEISKLLYCKLYDEKNKNKHKSRFYALENEDSKDTYKRIQRLYSEAAKLLPETFLNGKKQLGEDVNAVARVVKILQNYNLTKIPSDIKGTVYEELVRHTFDKTENQQFFTPRTVVKFMVDFISPQKDEVICDPASGTGGFLIEASNFIYNDKNPSNRGKLIGLEIDKRMAWVTQMNLLIHGTQKGEVYHLTDGGSLGFTQQLNNIIPEKSVDVILTNPPFGSDFTEQQHLKHYVLGKGKKSRRRGILFIERCLGWLKPGGKLALIIDDSVLNSTSNYDVREFIENNAIIEAIVSLPDVTFMPYATAKASILFLKKRGSNDKKLNSIFMADSQNVGRKPNGEPLISTEKDENDHFKLVNDLTDILNAWKLYNLKGEEAIKDLSPKIFIRKSNDVYNSQKNNRLDLLFHHPSKKLAEEALNKSKYPTPKLLELVTLRNISTIPNLQDPDDVWRYIGLANINAFSGEFLITEVMGSQIKSSVKLFKAGDILFSKLRPELRKITIIPDDEEDGYVSSECLVLFPNNENPKWNIDRRYLYLMLKSDIVFGQIIYQITGVGRPRVNASTILSLRIPLPPLEIQKELISAYELAQRQSTDAIKRSGDLIGESKKILVNFFDYATNKLFI